jgi:hypothetical protein
MHTLLSQRELLRKYGAIFSRQQSVKKLTLSENIIKISPL